MKTKLNVIFVATLVITMLLNPIFAATNTIIVTKDKASLNLSDASSLSTNIIKADAETGVIDVQTTMNNLKKANEGQTYENTEIYFVTHVWNTKGSKINENVIALCKKIVKENKNVKVGIVLENLKEHGTEGKSSDSRVLLQATDDETKIDEAKVTLDKYLADNLDDINNRVFESAGNLESALDLAIKSFSNDVNKVLINMHASLPGFVNGESDVVHYNPSSISSKETAIKKHYENIAKGMNRALIKLQPNNVKYFAFRPANSSFVDVWYNTDTGEKIATIDTTETFEDVYGTVDNPKHGKYYLLPEDESKYSEFIIASIDDLLVDLEELLPVEYTDIKVEQVFSKEVIENYDITTEDKNAKIEDGKITLNVAALVSGKSYTVKFKLTAKKENVLYKDLLNKEIKLLDNTTVEYNTPDSEESFKTAETPSVKYTVVEDKVEEKLPEDYVENPDTGI